MKKRLFVVTLVILMLLASPISILGELDIDETKDGVVRILAYDGWDWYQGSGFAIGEEGKPVSYIVTNSHVVSGMVDVYLYRGEDDMIPLYPTSIDLPVNDVAVMEISEPIYNIPPLVVNDGDKAKVGDAIYCLGFPANADFLDGSFSGKPEDITVTSGIVSKITSGADSVEFYQIDATINGGNSGGPLIDANGYVIGINSFILADSEGNSYGYNGSVFLDELIDALDSRGFKYMKASEVQATIATVDTTTNDNQDASDVDADADEDEDEDKVSTRNKKSSALGTGAIIGIVAVGALLLIIIVIVILVVALKGKKQPAPAPQPMPTPQQAPRPVVQQPQQPQQPRKTAMLLGISGQFSGRSINLNGQASFGRNPGNQVNYPSDYKGISGSHCILEFDGNAFYLTDLGSTYGTYLANGQKLNPRTKYTLSNGERFYLASQDEMFQVTING